MQGSQQRRGRLDAKNGFRFGIQILLGTSSFRVPRGFAR